MNGLVVGACALMVIAAAHSALGEVRVLGPLLAGDPLPGLPPAPAGRLLRFAWHATSLAWVALALLLLDVSASMAVLVAAGIPALVLVVSLRSHLAWPLFLLVVLAVFRADGHLSQPILDLLGAMAAAAVAIAGAVHVYWAAGGRKGGAHVIPTRAGCAGEDAVRFPSATTTLAVAALLFVYAGLLVAQLSSGDSSKPVTWLVVVGVVAFTARAIGDGRYVGFTKTVRDTMFARADDRWLTPLVVMLAIGSAATVL